MFVFQFTSMKLCYSHLVNEDKCIIKNAPNLGKYSHWSSVFFIRSRALLRQWTLAQKKKKEKKKKERETNLSPLTVAFNFQNKNQLSILKHIEHIASLYYSICDHPACTMKKRRELWFWLFKDKRDFNLHAVYDNCGLMWLRYKHAEATQSMCWLATVIPQKMFWLIRLSIRAVRWDLKSILRLIRRYLDYN